MELQKEAPQEDKEAHSLKPLAHRWFAGFRRGRLAMEPSSN
jgi:hypothetical protein